MFNLFELIRHKFDCFLPKWLSWGDGTNVWYSNRDNISGFDIRYLVIIKATTVIFEYADVTRSMVVLHAEHPQFLGKLDYEIERMIKALTPRLEILTQTVSPKLKTPNIQYKKIKL